MFVGHSSAQRLSFVPAPDSPIAVAGGPGNVAIGDVNQDAKPDLVVASGRSRSITVLLSQGEARFQVARGSPVSVLDSPGEMVLIDINTDRKLDLVLASHDSYGVMLLMGDGNGGFTLASNSPVLMKDGQRPHTHGLAMGDLNGDGKLDLVTANNEDNDVCVALGDGRGGFIRAPGSPFGVGKSPYPFALGDVNSDGHLDIVATSTAPSSRALTLLFGDGQAGFRRNEVALRTAQPWFVTIGDVNRDGKRDLVTTHSERSPLLTVLLGNGKGGFSEAPGSPFAAGKGAWRLAVGDLDGDGKHDIATSNLESDNVSVLLAR